MRKITGFLIAALFLTAILVIWIFAAITRVGPYKFGPVMGISFILIGIFMFIATEKKFPILVNPETDTEKRLRDIRYASIFAIVLGILAVLGAF